MCNHAQAALSVYMDACCQVQAETAGTALLVQRQSAQAKSTLYIPCYQFTWLNLVKVQSEKSVVVPAASHDRLRS